MKKLYIFLSLCLASIFANASSINVVFILTPNAIATFGSAATFAALEAARMNSAFSGSFIGHTIVNAGSGTTQVEYNHGYAAWQLALQEPSIKIAHDKFAADVVFVVGNGGALPDYQYACGDSGSGLGGVWLGPTKSLVVVQGDCSVVNYSSMHFLGHVMGARENIDQDTNTAPFANSHGFDSHLREISTPSNPETCFGDLMSETGFACIVGRGGPGCTVPIGVGEPWQRLLVYSNPAVSHAGLCAFWANDFPVGDSFAQSSSVLNSTGSTVATYRNTKWGAGIYGAIATILFDTP